MSPVAEITMQLLEYNPDRHIRWLASQWLSNMGTFLMHKSWRCEDFAWDGQWDHLVSPPPLSASFSPQFCALTRSPGAPHALSAGVQGPLLKGELSTARTAMGSRDKEDCMCVAGAVRACIVLSRSNRQCAQANRLQHCIQDLNCSARVAKCWCRVTGENDERSFCRGDLHQPQRRLCHQELGELPRATCCAACRRCLQARDSRSRFKVFECGAASPLVGLLASGMADGKAILTI